MAGQRNEATRYFSNESLRESSDVNGWSPCFLWLAFYAWSAGYDASKRDKDYLDLFQSRDPRKVFRLLKENGINYVAIDNAVRRGEFVKRHNEQIYSTYFQKVFEDRQNKYDLLTIYKVPDTEPPNLRLFQNALLTCLRAVRGPSMDS